MALGSTQLLTEMSARNISWGVKAVGTYGWQPYHLHVTIILKSGSLNFLEPFGHVQASNGIATCFTFYYSTYHCVTIAYSIQYSNMLYKFVA